MTKLYSMQTTRRFDFEFIGDGNINANHVLWIRMRLCLQQVFGSTVVVLGRKWNIQEWKTSEWHAYKLMVRAAAGMWDKRFTLIPPNSADMFAYKGPGGSTFMPNVECRFELKVQDSPAGAHKTLRVVRLSDRFNYAPGDFPMSAAGMWDSADQTFNIQEIADDVGKIHMHATFPIAHEIGHLLGQEHAGYLYNRKDCTDAKMMELERREPTDPDFKNGASSEVCYGKRQPAYVADNIMGIGPRFDTVNAQPWKEIMVLKVGEGQTRGSEWKVGLNEYAPFFPPRYLKR
jgi:hypothetical protein